MKTEKVRYSHPGLHAISQQAFGLDFIVAQMLGLPGFELQGTDAIVEVRGPITFSGGPNGLLDTYEGVQRRFGEALASDAVRVIVKFDSPGGEVAGAFDCARNMRKMARAVNKPYVAFTGSTMASAAYALASGADYIVATDTAEVGSIGVINVTVDATKADAAQGLNFAIFASGDHKADSNPHKSLTDEARAAIQGRVDTTAGVFFGMVGAFRGLEPATIAALQANLFIGHEAQSKGLVDHIMPWTQLIAEPLPVRGYNKDTTMAFDRKALATAAASEDKDEARRASRALAAWDKDEEGDEEKEKKDKEAKAKASAKAEEKKEDEEECMPPKGKAAASIAADTRALDASIASMATELQAARVQIDALTAKAAADTMSAFLATRPDLDAKVIATLAGLPFERVKAIVDSIPVSRAGQLARPATQGANHADIGQAHGVRIGDTESIDEMLDRKFGLNKGYVQKVVFDEEAGVQRVVTVAKV